MVDTSGAEIRPVSEASLLCLHRIEGSSLQVNEIEISKSVCTEYAGPTLRPWQYKTFISGARWVKCDGKRLKESLTCRWHWQSLGREIGRLAVRLT